ncbi:TBC1 domain family member 22A [Microtus ochrogaster]|uniref:TBC1 domain family member 22A n=1 Tax=Microtus ochrogaster TaxID=79684 RepID=A0A8J6H2H1_MICOH|nr:TBC1 domain family member 22A [Microtus ochrogaster]
MDACSFSTSGGYQYYLDEGVGKGYLPANVDRRPATLQRKQKEYFAFIEHYYKSRNDEVHQDTYRQIHIDIPRMSPEALILQPKVTEIFERILFIWAIRHPASGYVQGINDLVTPFFVVFICEYIDQEDVDEVDVSSVPAEVLRNIEADTYWCMSKLLDGIQDNYTFAQPGIQMKVKMLEELVSRIDERTVESFVGGTGSFALRLPDSLCLCCAERVHRHLDGHEVRYLQFAFRWMNNLLMRELPLRCTIRLWDTYQSEPEGFSHFHLYVCAAFLVRWRREILEERDFQSPPLLISATTETTTTITAITTTSADTVVTTATTSAATDLMVVVVAFKACQRIVSKGTIPLCYSVSKGAIPLCYSELLLFLQNLPTARWDDQDVSLLLAEAYRLKFAFADAPNHYKKLATESLPSSISSDSGGDKLLALDGGFL